MAEVFFPKIIGFLCNWCSYAGADLAGVSRIQYPTNLRVIRLMCSARVDVAMIMKAFLYGIDGVFVSGCHLGDCHYMEGNYHTVRKIKMARKILAYTGIRDERLFLDWVSAAEGNRFAGLVSQFTKTIKELGPLGVIEGLDKKEVERRMRAAVLASSSEKLRWLVGMERKMTEGLNAFEETVEEKDFERAQDDAILYDYHCSEILCLLQEKPMSVKEMAERMSLSLREVFCYTVDLRLRNQIDIQDTRDRTPIYKSLVAV